MVIRFFLDVVDCGPGRRSIVSIHTRTRLGLRRWLLRRRQVTRYLKKFLMFQSTNNVAVIFLPLHLLNSVKDPTKEVEYESAELRNYSNRLILCLKAKFGNSVAWLDFEAEVDWAQVEESSV